MIIYLICFPKVLQKCNQSIHISINRYLMLVKHRQHSGS